MSSVLTVSFGVSVVVVIDDDLGVLVIVVDTVEYFELFICVVRVTGTFVVRTDDFGMLVNVEIDADPFVADSVTIELKVVLDNVLFSILASVLECGNSVLTVLKFGVSVMLNPDLLK